MQVMGKAKIDNISMFVEITKSSTKFVEVYMPIIEGMKGAKNPIKNCHRLAGLDSLLMRYPKGQTKGIVFETISGFLHPKTSFDRLPVSAVCKS